MPIVTARQFPSFRLIISEEIAELLICICFFKKGYGVGTVLFQSSLVGSRPKANETVSNTNNSAKIAPLMTIVLY